MSQLIAAAIGAGGALGGVVVAGLFTLAQARRNSSDRELDRLEQRRNVSQQARREIYSQMVSLLRRASAAHEAIWRSNPVELRQSGSEAFTRSRTLEDEVEHAANFVMLAGPPELGEHAEDVYYQFSDLIRIAEKIVKDYPDSTQALFDLASSDQENSDMRFIESRIKFTRQAREVLGDHK
ncbi:hypothetical protein [Streptomyces corynorhini]|uniref:hypothetical protein n=1 Tax=Streptomyces corynorhini TaxID=2282652 RepID=UPI0011C019E2|nr:hypothetical protein [Streptomyces corynorhini]